MKTTQYVRQWNAVEAADRGSIRERWMFGLRLLHDDDVMSPTGKSLRHGAAEKIIAAAGVDAKGRNRISDQEIQRCLRCARAYPKESQIRHAVTDFGAWRDLVAAGFPEYDAPADEPPADYRTDVERRHDRNRALAALSDHGSEQDALFPLSVFEPTAATLKELQDYASEQAAMTARFAAHDQKRQRYLDRLIVAADGDLSVIWQDAHERLETSEAGVA